MLELFYFFISFSIPLQIIIVGYYNYRIGNVIFTTYMVQYLYSRIYNIALYLYIMYVYV